LKEQKNINKVIIDLRNNWWGYLNEVAEILSYFIKQWEITASVRYHDTENNYESRGYDLIDFSKYKIVILQNSGTASASEILIWTLKDYYPNIDLIWENTYGKWSVQVMKNYKDWSLLKYTIAKWFTWKTKTWIDWVWIKPTIELELDLENFNKNKIDNQLEKALITN
jgi:carboxyl-terminal processing protease